jgi:hypothetical protein
MPEIVLANEFDIDSVNFTPPRPNRLGGQSVLLNYSNGEESGAFVMQTCRVRLPFGIDQSKPQGQEAVKYHFSFSMANDETQNEKLRQLTANVRSIDAKAKQCPVDSELWFGKKLSGEFVSEFYKSAEKFPKDSKWPSTLKVKLPFDKKGIPQFVLYDENKKTINILDENGQIDHTCIPKGCEAVCLIQSTGVWFVGKTQFGVGYKLVQAKIYKSNKLTGYSIVDSEPEDEDEDEKEKEDEDVE